MVDLHAEAFTVVPKFAHLPLLLVMQGRKLSKRTHQKSKKVVTTSASHVAVAVALAGAGKTPATTGKKISGLQSPNYRPHPYTE